MIRKSSGALFGIALSCALLAVGCGSSSTTSSGGNSASSSKSSAAAASTSSSGKTYTMKIGYATVGDVQDLAVQDWAKEITKLSGGQIKVQVYGGQKLGSNAAVNQGIVSGSVQGTSDIPGFYGQYIPLMQVLDAPYLFPSDPASVMKILSDSKVMAPLDQQALSKGFRIVGWQFDSPDWVWAKKAITTVAGLKGVKIRAFATPIVANYLKAWGMTPVSMPPAELYTALSQGTVSATLFGWDTSAGAKIYEVAPYANNLGEADVFIALAVSEKWFQTLPKNLQQDVIQAGQYQTQHWQDTYNAWFTAHGATIDKAVPKSHRYTFTAAQQKQLYQESLPSYQTMYSSVPGAKAFAQAIQAAQGK